MDNYEFSEKEKEIVWAYVGGKPVYLVELMNAKRDGKEIEQEAKRLLQIRTSQILSIFDEIALKKVEFVENDIAEEFKNFETEETIRYDRVNKVKVFLVGRNILFIDPTQRTIKPQSKLNLIAIRAVLKKTFLSIRKLYQRDNIQHFGEMRNTAQKVSSQINANVKYYKIPSKSQFPNPKKKIGVEHIPLTFVERGIVAH